jgi:molybdenum cofactor synthesis domain-containing protein
MRVAVVTVSDGSFAGTQEDTSGESIRLWCERREYAVVSHDVVPDEQARITPLLASLCDSGSVDLIITTGGTGLGPRDVTPEATLAVMDREAQGIAEYIRAQSLGRFPRAALSRGVAGLRGKTLIINLPGSLNAVTDGLAAIVVFIDHAVGVVTGQVTRHDTPPYGQSAI